MFFLLFFFMLYSEEKSRKLVPLALLLSIVLRIKRKSDFDIVFRSSFFRIYLFIFLFGIYERLWTSVSKR